MLPANNKGLGMSAGFPDVCLSPVLGLFPFPNFSFNAMKVPFSPNVWFSMLPALNMASFSPISLGDQLGTLHPTFMGTARHTFGNFRTLINFLPSTSLVCPRMGNNFNCPLGLQVIPSLTNVFLTFNARAAGAAADAAADTGEGTGAAESEGAPGAAGERRAAVLPVDVDRLLASLDPCGEGAPVEVAWLGEGVGYVRIRRFSLDVPARVHTALASLLAEGLTSLVLDLRDNPGGELSAFLELAGDFLEPGSVVARAVDADGDETVYRARHEDPYQMPLQILVNRGTASAAELFAGCLQWHGRAVIAGEPTYGKGTALTFQPDAGAGAPGLAAVASLLLPGGQPVHGHGVRPDGG
ncbi:S41 family peptidase [Chondromyces apiculatus]|uniref:Carboxyl-terminal processing protease n=1 Tax=Chondromyces apiculatus DSM 436 TaxID=1192034 RepID=A0A017T1L7_9BACT|nr:S41 family peptidase [Chondromyces apiculatus]EYF03144.1 Carboxyl-terminal processing protease [Chondromyces apiculatus DSM 436]